MGDAAGDGPVLPGRERAPRDEPRGALPLGFVERVAEVGDACRGLGAESVERGERTDIGAHDVEPRRAVGPGLERAAGQDLVDARGIDAAGEEAARDQAVVGGAARALSVAARLAHRGLEYIALGVLELLQRGGRLARGAVAERRHEVELGRAGRVHQRFGAVHGEQLDERRDRGA